jgi:hypothetical protein
MIPIIYLISYLIYQCIIQQLSCFVTHLSALKLPSSFFKEVLSEANSKLITALTIIVCVDSLLYKGLLVIY